MKHTPGRFAKLPWQQDQLGITGLETAIVLIAFLVVSSVSAFAALSTSLFSSDKAKEAIRSGLDDTRSTLELKGSIALTVAKNVVTSEAVSGAATPGPHPLAP